MKSAYHWLQKQANNTYIVRTRFRSENGWINTSTSPTYDKIKAQKILYQKKMEDQDKFLGIVNTDKPLSNAVNEYIDEVERTLSPTTAASVRSIIPAFANNFQKVRDLTKSRIRDYRQSLLDKKDPPLSLFTVRSKLRHISAFLSWMVKTGKMAESPFQGIIIPNPQANPKYLKDEEIKALDETATGWIKLAFRIAYTTGMRLQNVIGLRHEDRQDGMFVVQLTKGKRPVSVPVHPLVDKLWPKHGQGRVFPDIDRNRAEKAFSKLRKAADVPEATWHTARHTFVMKSVQSGLSTFEVMQFTGHVSPQSMQPYAHFEMGKLKDRYKKIKF